MELSLWDFAGQDLYVRVRVRVRVRVSFAGQDLYVLEYIHHSIREGRRER
jgi:hypothetical protein